MPDTRSCKTFLIIGRGSRLSCQHIGRTINTGIDDLFECAFVCQRGAPFWR